MERVRTLPPPRRRAATKPTRRHRESQHRTHTMSTKNIKPGDRLFYICPESGNQTVATVREVYDDSLYCDFADGCDGVEPIASFAMLE
jgi:hypothetical protein